MAMALRHSSSPHFHFLLSQNVKHRGKGNHVKLLGGSIFPISISSAGVFHSFWTIESTGAVPYRESRDRLRLSLRCCYEGTQV